MKNALLNKIILLFTFNLLMLNVFSQAPQSFKYQSVVRDANGNAMQNQSVDFKISILQTTSTGISVYTEEFSTTTNNFGLVNLEIGTGNVLSGTFSTINWGTDKYFLQVELDPDGNGYQLMGISQLLSVPYALNAAKADNVNNNDTSTTNELQNLSQTGTSVTLSNGGGTITVADNDNDSNNEIQAISFSGDTLYLSNGNSVYLGNYSNIWQQNGNDIYYNNGYVGVGLTDPHGKLIIQGDASIPIDSAIFEVRNKDGQVVFAVYQEGVRIYVDDTGTKAISSKGGFAVGGFNATKSLTNEYLRVTPDSIRVYIEDDNGSKAISTKGGFAIGGFNATKSYTNTYMRVTDDSTRIWTEDSIAGFGIQSIGSTENNDYMHIDPSNYFIGHQAGFNTVPSTYSGINNIFVGYKSGFNNTTGHENVFLGFNSGLNNTTGDGNTFIGEVAGYKTTTGFWNVFVGQRAGYANTTGYVNVMIGQNSGSSNKTGSGNICIGDNACHQDTNGLENVYVGRRAGMESLGDYNVMLGSEAGGANYVSGGADINNSILIGRKAGFTAHGDNNILIGSESDVDADDCILIGNSLTSTQSNILKIDDGNNNSNPLIYGDFSNDIIEFNAHRVETKHTTGYGVNGLFINNTGNSDKWSLYQYSTGDLHIIFNSTDIGKFDQTSGTYTALSDKKLKKNIKPLTNVLSKVNLLEPKIYNFKTQRDNTKKYIGFIAQDVIELFPSLVSYSDESDIFMLDYSGFGVVAIEAIKEQQKIINQLKKENTEILKRLNEIEKQLNK